MKNKKDTRPIIFIDMDQVLADFQRASGSSRRHPPKMFEAGFFEMLEPMPGALRAVRELIQYGFRVEILTQPVSESVISYTEKAAWIAKWFPELTQHLTMTQDKTMLMGDVLIDDSKKWSGFKGEFILFDDTNSLQAWKSVVKYLKKKYETQLKHI